MKCPFCAYLEDKVVDSRESREGDAIRRRRECATCTARFTTYERVEAARLVVVKRDGRYRIWFLLDRRGGHVRSIEVPRPQICE